MYVTETTDIAVSGSIVWQILSDFGSIQKWNTGIRKCQSNGDTVGSVRRITTDDEKQILERLEGIDHEAKTISFRGQRESIPSIKYLTVTSVEDLGTDKCRVIWSASSSAEDPKLATQVKMQILQILSALKHHCELESTQKPLKKLKPRLEN